jgi:AcrR family transcriptional regulator
MEGASVEARAGGVGSDDRRRGEILDAAFSVLAERGYRGASTREIAERARASKETLYSWFGDKRGLFEELIRRQAEGVGEALSASLERGTEEPAVVLRAFAVELLRLLLGERAVVINRAAISEAAADPTFARILTAGGRSSIVPKLESYLEGQRSRGRLDFGPFGDASAAAEALIGLTIGDRQVRRLLGTLPMPEPEQIEALAERAVAGFLKLFARSFKG